MLTLTKQGLYCAVGDFYIDPRRGVEHALITHAHSDHARRGSQQYYTVACGAPLLKARLSQNISVATYEYGERFQLRGVEISFHPAGHILGSAQVRLQFGDEVWVVSGDYKRDADPTCQAFEPVPCDVFVTEATFGTPAFAWPKDQNLGREIAEWWHANADRGLNSVLFAYSLGKAQRVLGVLKQYAKQPVYCHPATTELTECYRAQGVQLADTVCVSQVAEGEVLKGALVLVPSSFLKSEQAKILGGQGQYVTAFASGWMAKNKAPYSGYDHGFVMSDHADWKDLLRTIDETGAKRVYVQHRGHGALVKHLRAKGLAAYPETALTFSNPEQMALF